MRQPCAPKRDGVTLLEIVISVFLISTIVLSSLMASVNLLENQALGDEREMAEELIFMVLDEITAQPFEDVEDNRIFGREDDETSVVRTSFDDVDDYDGLINTPPQNRDGTTVSEYANWTLNVSVRPAEPTSAGTAISTENDAPLRLVTVAVTSPAGTAFSESAIVSSLPSDVDETTSFEKWRRLTLTFSDRSVDVTVPLRNQPDQSQAN